MHVLLPVARGKGKHELAVEAAGTFLQSSNKLRSSRKLAFFPALRIEAELRFGGDPNRAQIEIDIAREQYITCCSRKPVNRNVENNKRSATRHIR
jgi:hypothetical protein